MASDDGTVERAVVALPRRDPSQRFAPMDAALVEMAYAMWSMYAGRSGTRTLRMLARELGADADLPTAATINRWAIEQGWSARHDAELGRSHNRTLYDLQVGWLAGLRQAQQVLQDAMAGMYDDEPLGGAPRLKAAEIVLRTIERAGLLAILPQARPERTVDPATLPLEERESVVRDQLRARKGTT